jgi:hypothetical protein
VQAPRSTTTNLDGSAPSVIMYSKISLCKNVLICQFFNTFVKKNAYQVLVWNVEACYWHPRAVEISCQHEIDVEVLHNTRNIYS